VLQRVPTTGLNLAEANIKAEFPSGVITDIQFLKRRGGKAISICTETCKSSVKMQIITGFTLGGELH
jgi:hypothetical protein